MNLVTDERLDLGGYGIAQLLHSCATGMAQLARSQLVALEENEMRMRESRAQ
jgi:hypothetical protein